MTQRFHGHAASHVGRNYTIVTRIFNHSRFSARLCVRRRALVRSLKTYVDRGYAVPAV
jgi:hypothetical protein